MSFAHIGSAGQTPQKVQQNAQNTVASARPNATEATAAAAKSQDKLKFALVDSGMGGGMTAAFLRGEVRQLGSYYCLPIGEKPAANATAYTAAMALWPMVAPLADSHGEDDGRVAENVIIACNSASVRRDDALGLMADYCKAVADDHANKMGLDPQIKQNIVALHSKAQTDPKYFDKHVKEIVSETARCGAEEANLVLKNRDHAFVRIDSTNGTADSAAYPKHFKDELSKHADGNVERATFKREIKMERIEGGKKSEDKYTVNYDVFTFSQGGKAKVVVVESRGNPPWVPAIESNAVEQKGEAMVEESTSASEQAAQALNQDPAFLEFLNKLPEGHRHGVTDALEAATSVPDIHMLCCTHYPAMRPALSERYADAPGPKVKFVDQASIVKGIAIELDQDAADSTRPALDLALTVGSQNYGGSSGYLQTSVPEGDKTAATLKTVLDATLSTSPINENTAKEIGSVQVFSQGQPDPVIKPTAPIRSGHGLYQEQFENMHRFIGGPLTTRMLKEQGLELNPNPGLDRPKYALTPEAQKEKIRPVATPVARQIAQNFTETTKERFNRIGELMTLGEARGIETIALYNDQGAQLAVGVARVLEIKDYNSRHPEAPHSIGILTGFTVVDNSTKERKGGENDGPPGAVLMARKLLQQGVPVTLVVDQSSEASLVAALVGSGLANLTPEAEERVKQNQTEHKKLTVKDLVLLHPANEGRLKFEIPAVNNSEPGASTPEERKAAVEKSAVHLRESNVTTMISIERPSVTADGRMTSMVGIDISPFNLDMNPILRDEQKGHVPFRIGMGDGGNEFGTGGIAKRTRTAREPDLKLAVRNGNHIAASPEHATEVMLLGTVSNHCGMVFAMGLDAATLQGKDAELRQKLDDTVETYNSTIIHMHGVGMSMDGVKKENLRSVDGRPLGSRTQAERRFIDMAGQVPLGVDQTGPQGPNGETTHNDVFLKFRNAMLSNPPIQSKL